MLGVLLALSTSLAWGLMAVGVRLGMQHLRAPVGTLISLFSSLALALVWVLLVEFHDLVSVSLAAVAWFALIGVLNFALARYFLILGIGLLGAARSQPIISTSPLFATVLAVTFLGESLTPLMLLGILSVVAGLYLLTSRGEA
ncbi:MAG: EamA family transporter [Dehalococcoidia bacterium]